MKLNPGQNEAVKYVSGPCLVLAGAGSGKTGVICQKIAYLIQKCDYKARNIAASAINPDSRCLTTKTVFHY